MQWHCLKSRPIWSTATLSLVCACVGGSSGEWYRGNTHTHSLWSDGDAAPEQVVAWYKENGYDWLSITDHDVLLRGERWIGVAENGRLSPERVSELREKFGDDWVVTRDTGGITEMRIRTLDELRDRFEEPLGFLLIEGEEISDESEGKPLHFNVFNTAAMIPAQDGEDIMSTVERNLVAVRRQADSSARNMLVHINHTNWRWTLTPEQLALMEGTHLFELYNGSSGCNNYGDSTHPGMDEVWDIANTVRLVQLDLPPLYGVANNDSHDYYQFTPDKSHPGRGWIMVRADTPCADSILNAMRAGEFYSSTGVELREVLRGPKEYVVRIAREPGVTCTTQFIGTRMTDGIPGEPGMVLHETAETTAIYPYRGDELYVRAKIISSRMQSLPAAGEEAPEYAWTQPVVVGR